MNSWYVYIVQCRDNSLYTGVTVDLVRRIDEHNHSDRLGAKYTRTRRPVTLIYECQLKSRSAACILESQIKKMTRQQKEAMIANNKVDSL
jgi:putative endonuclease